MNENEANQAASRIGKLWPTLNFEQLTEVARAMVRETVDFQIVDDAISEIYREGSKFFELSALMSKLKRARQSLVDPLSQPNSFESQARRRERENREWERDALQLAADREAFRSLPLAEQQSFIEEFKTTPQYFGGKAAYDHRLGRSQLPAGMLAWWKSRMGEPCSKA